MLIPIESISVSERQRKGDSIGGSQSLEHINTLASSMDKYGLLQPILVMQGEDGTKGFELVAGFNRLHAARFLEWENIEALISSELDPITKKEVELEENIRRKNLEWWEKAAAVAEIHDMRTAEDPEWSMRKTAELIGESLGTIQQSVDLQKAIDEDDSLKEEITLVSALRRRKETKQLDKRKAEIERQQTGQQRTAQAIIHVGDALDLIKEEKDETYDAIVTNFPFGVDLRLKHQGAKENREVYDDNETEITHLVQAVVKESFRVLKDDSWMVAFFDIRKICYNNFQARLNSQILSQYNIDPGLIFDSMGLTWWMEEAGFSYVTPLPGIWAKPNKSQGLIGNPAKGMVVAYEALVFAAKGDAILLKRGRNNLFVYDTPLTGDRVHPLQMPTDLCSELISMVCLGGSHILDPFAGSGSIGLGALDNQCSFVGYEIDPEMASNGNLRLNEHHFSTPEEEDDN
ncbi:MAG: DNA methyltransferase [Nitrosopumilus sp.]